MPFILKISLIVLAISFGPLGKLLATDGMWLPQLLKQLNEQEMQEMGMELSAEDIYSVNKSSLKDAIVSFGGFCTAEVISAEGLLLTNHHCGYGQLQSHSNIEHNLLKDGFWAMDRRSELPNPGLYVSFIVRIENVTEFLLEDLQDDLPEEQREQQIAERSRVLMQVATEDTHYEASIKSFYYGNEYYMFITETYRDVRLVGAPPESIGKFGGDADNWMWPRHTGDFSLFRVYTAPDGSPAEYSDENVPLKPKYHLPISLEGYQEGDFTLVFGFPGSTTQYLPSTAIENLVSKINPHRINVREQKLAIMQAAMKADETVRIQYASKYASTANAYKKWIGENNGLQRLEAVQEKIDQERALQTMIDAQSNSRFDSHLIDNINEQYKAYFEFELPYNYLRESVYGVEALALARRFHMLTERNMKTPQYGKMVELLEEQVVQHFKNYDRNTDQQLFSTLMQLYVDSLENKFVPAEMLQIRGDRDKAHTLAEEFYEESIFTDKVTLCKFLQTLNKQSINRLKKDPIFKLTREFDKIYTHQIAPDMISLEKEINVLQRKYMAALQQMHEDKYLFPDANSTLRVSYGTIDWYQPRDAVYYSHYSTLQGVMEKEDLSMAEFQVPEKLKSLYALQDYGPYGIDGMMPVAFTATNHTTGGNSGSPVINGRGELIGLNFDRNWEGTMSDIMYDPEMCRNISVDVRYILFIVDKFAGAGHLVDEMTLVNVPDEMGID